MREPPKITDCAVAENEITAIEICPDSAYLVVHPHTREIVSTEMIFSLKAQSVSTVEPAHVRRLRKMGEDYYGCQS